ncbi:MAG: aldose 1-epimerase family protein [Clostridiales bacterium]|jgi:galactose mutarotase-like enzyme|nr:aldose 1-epimerase family protein [Clostridiales bacterium]
MVYKIENEFLTVQVESHGAQLHSVESKNNHHEYLWQGNADVWSGRAPILFPIVGQLKDGKYRHCGKSYELPKHGFARNSYFKVKAHSPDKLDLELKFSPETLKLYPFKFKLLVSHRLEGHALVVSHFVYNLSQTDIMYFSIGAHPGFNCSMGDLLEFELAETLSSLQIDPNHALLTKIRKPILNNSEIIEIKRDTFEEDALIFEGLKSQSVWLRRQEKGQSLKFDFGRPSFLGLWAKPAAPYVCIEPWYGINDSPEDYGELANKPAIESLPAGGVFSFSWKLSFEEI